METPAAYTVDGFCRAHGIGRTTFYKLKKEGLGPRTMRVMGKVLVSHEAAAEWRRLMESSAPPKPAAA